MRFFSRKEQEKTDELSVQTSPSQINSYPFSRLDRYLPLSNTSMSLYKTLREGVPVIDAALGKIVRLLGSFTVECRDKAAQKELDLFIKNVQVNGCSCSLFQFLSTYFDQLITYGEAVGEIVLSQDGRRIAALYNADLHDIELQSGKGPLDIAVCVKNTDGSFERAKYQQLICCSLLNPQPGTLQGTSLLSGLEFVSSILLKVFDSVGKNFERIGNIRFAVTYKPSEQSNCVNSKQRANEIAKEWSRAMRDSTQVCDFVSVGDVSIKAIGADNQTLDCDVPIRHILEQIVSKLSIPPFLLGLSWSSTERMSTQQADILTSELLYYRMLLNPVITRICSLFLRLQGYDDMIDINWNNISLQDETELATARLDNARALQIEQAISEVNE